MGHLGILNFVALFFNLQRHAENLSLLIDFDGRLNEGDLPDLDAGLTRWQTSLAVDCSMPLLLLFWFELTSVHLSVALDVVSSWSRPSLARIHRHVVLTESVKITDNEWTCNLFVRV